MFDVYGLGNAIVDTEVNVEDSFLEHHGIAKGHMTLVDTPRMQALVQDLPEQHMRRCSGGSAANTTYAAQAFGHRTAYACKISDDQAGQFFQTDMSAAGVYLNDTACEPGGQSAQCLILITDDAERTMNTDLGISVQLARSNVDFAQLKQSRYFYVEGYLSSSETATDATLACREAATEAGVAAAVSLADPSMVSFFREPLEKILGNGTDIIFCNEEEALTWANTDRLDVAVNELRDISPLLFITLGAQGSMVVANDQQTEVAGFATDAVDTTGAGDMYAGAALSALCDGADAPAAARFANFCASHIVSRYGARLTDQAAYSALRAAYS